MIQRLLSSQIQSFIEEHKLEDPHHLLLKYKDVFQLPTSLVVDQITGRKKAKEKLPTWFKNTQIIYPPLINVEQSSSEKAARYKAKILVEYFGTETQVSTMVDLTAGLGIDSFFFSKIFREVHFIEQNKHLLEIAQHNHHQLEAKNLHYYNTSAEEFLKSTTRRFDFVYIDPSRRSRGNQKVFSLDQCEPNALLLQEQIWQLTDNVLVKASPLLDVHTGLTELKYVKKLVIISINNDCKELLFVCEKNFNAVPTIEAINIKDENEDSISFLVTDERDADVNYSEPLEYLYEPNASILKSGAFKTIGVLFNVYKLHPNTHLYTSKQFVENFPGRIFQIQSLVKPDAKALKKFFLEGKANITTRNYTLSVDELRKKTGLKDGGDKFLIGFSGIKKKFLVVATKMN